MNEYGGDGLIYYLLDATRLNQRVKIGYTQALGDRLNGLVADTMMRQRPIVLALEAGGTALEKERHDQFGDLWTMGEWFDYGSALAEHLQGMPNPLGWLTDRPELWHFARGWQSFTGWSRQRSCLNETVPGEDRSAPDYAQEPLRDIQF